MKRQEFLLNLTLLVIIGALVYLIYDYKDSAPRSLADLDESISTSELATSGKSGGKSGKNDSARKDGAAGKDGPAGRNGSRGKDGSTANPSIPGKETNYATGDREGDEGNEPDENGEGTPKEQDKFGETNIFRSLLTPTPTPPPPTPTPAPTPDIGVVLGQWKLLSVYNGKAMIEDLKLSAEGAEGAIFELAPGESKQVDSGGGAMKTATLKSIDSSNPYNPEISLGLEGTDKERKINLDTEPAAAAPAAGQPKPK